jgi:hypothetical protein
MVDGLVCSCCEEREGRGEELGGVSQNRLRRLFRRVSLPLFSVGVTPRAAMAEIRRED